MRSPPPPEPVEISDLKISGLRKFKFKNFNDFDLFDIDQREISYNKIIASSSQKDPRMVYRFGLKIKSFYKIDAYFFIIILTLSFLFSYKLVQYLSKFKLSEQKSRIDIVFVCVFSMFLFIPMSDISKAEKDMQENRMLAPYPLLVDSGKINLKFGEQFEKWFNDHFNGRQEMMLFYHNMQPYFVDVFRTDSATFYRKTNWMFNGGQLKQRIISENEAESIVGTLNKFSEFMNENKIDLYLLIVPSKIDVYKKFAYDYQNLPENQYGSVIERLKKEADFPVIFPYEELRKNAFPELTYFKTEHHWTEWGAYIGYGELIKNIRKKYPEISMVSEDDYDIFYNRKVRGDWGRDFREGHTFKMLNLKWYPKLKVLDTKYKYYTSKHEIKPKITDGPFYKTKEFFNPDLTEGKRVLLMGTSMNENLLQFLPYSFKELKYFRLNNVTAVHTQDDFKVLKRYKKDILEYQPDIFVLCVTAENLPSAQNLFKD